MSPPCCTHKSLVRCGGLSFLSVRDLLRPSDESHYQSVQVPDEVEESHNARHSDHFVSEQKKKLFFCAYVLCGMSIIKGGERASCIESEHYHGCRFVSDCQILKNNGKSCKHDVTATKVLWLHAITQICMW
jgi:hypothetical protein